MLFVFPSVNYWKEEPYGRAGGYYERTWGRAVKAVQEQRGMLGPAGSSALIPLQHNNKQDYRQEQKTRLRKDGEMGKVQVGGTEGSL